MNNIILQEYENEHPNIVIEKDKTISGNDLEWGEQYILLIIDTDNEDPPDINQVVYQGKTEERGVFKLDNEILTSHSSSPELTRITTSFQDSIILQNPDCVIRKEGVMSHFFRTDSKPRRFYNVLSTDIDVDCFFYKMTTR